MEKTKFKNINILEAINKLPEIVSENNWKIEYNKKLDRLYWTQPKISHSSGLINFGNEYSFYINPKGSLEGLFIEYFKNNFIEHNQDFKNITKSLTKEIDDNIFTISNESQKDEFIHLSRAIKAETLGMALENKEDYSNIKIPINQ